MEERKICEGKRCPVHKLEGFSSRGQAGTRRAASGKERSMAVGGFSTGAAGLVSELLTALGKNKTR